jgi:hypothetical protein
MALRELATAWVRANCPNRAVHKDFLKHLDRAVGHGVGCTFLVGRELTKRAKPMLVTCHCGELFAFDLSTQQIERLCVNDNMLVCWPGATRQDHGPKPEPLVWLEEVDVVHASCLDRNAPITGTLRYRTDRLFLEPLAIHVTCEPPGRASMTLYSYPPALHPPAGAIRFSCSSLGDMPDRDGVRFAGAVPLFFRVFTADEPVRPAVAAPHVAPIHGSHTPATSWPHHVPLPPTSGLPSIKPVMPAHMPFPPTYDPGVPVVPNTTEVRAISDIRAVLVDVV